MCRLRIILVVVLVLVSVVCLFFYFCVKQKTAYEMRISDCSSDVCSSDLVPTLRRSQLPRRSRSTPRLRPRPWRRQFRRPWPDGDDRSDIPARHSSTRVPIRARSRRSEEHTSELQSLMRISYAVFCLKKKKKTTTHQQSKTEYYITTTHSSKTYYSNHNR